MPAAKSPRSTPAIPRSHWRPPPPARAQPGRHDRRRPEGRQSLSRPRPPAGHTALDRHASPNTPPAPHARPSAPCCLDEVTLHDRDPAICRCAPQPARAGRSVVSLPRPPATLRRRNDRCRPRHEPWPTRERPLPRQKTTRPSTRWPYGTRSPTGTRYLPSFDALSDRVSVATGLGDGRGHHDRWLEVAVTGNVRILELPEYIICAPLVARALTRSASADLHCHPAGADRQSTARLDRAERSEPQSGARDGRGAEATRTELSVALLTRRPDRPGAACSAGSRLGVVTIGYSMTSLG